jgi:hypothetical protein
MFSFAKKDLMERIPPVGMDPGRVARYRAWVVLEDGRVAYIDHYKADGRFGVRPVDPATGQHYQNPSPHWSEVDRKRYPEELGLSLAQFRAATMEEIPQNYQR